MLPLEQITEQMRALAVEAGSFLREERKKFTRDRVEEKSSHDYVSYVDKESERRIVERLHALLPQAGFIAEEGTATLESHQEYCWLVDPLDGTTNYIHDNAPYCVSIALRNRKELLAGVVYEVCRNECFWAWKGSAAYLNGQEIHVSSVATLDMAFIELGFPYDYRHFSPFVVNLIQNLYGKVGGERLLGAAAVEMCYIAMGRFEARIEGYLGPWDIAAGTLILQQAGGRVTDFEGGQTFYSGRELLATNGLIHEEMLSIISKIKKSISL